MPIYTYKCIKCENRFEKIVPIAERDNQKCEKGHDAVRGLDRPGGLYAPTATGGTLKVG